MDLWKSVLVYHKADDQRLIDLYYVIVYLFHFSFEELQLSK